MEGTSNGERTMNTKRIAALASLSALILTAGPAMAANPTGTVTVKWNTQQVAAITMYTQTTASKIHATTTPTQDIYWASDPAGSTTSGCNGTIATASAGGDASANLTVSFGNVTPDSADYTDCLETNAVDAYITTNDSNGYSVSVTAAQSTGSDYGAANGSGLCILPDGTWANNLAWTTSARTAAVANNSTTTCPSGDFYAGTTATSLLTATALTAGTELNSDLELTLAPNAQTTGANAVTLTYTLTPS